MLSVLQISRARARRGKEKTEPIFCRRRAQGGGESFTLDQAQEGPSGTRGTGEHEWIRTLWREPREKLASAFSQTQEPLRGRRAGSWLLGTWDALDGSSD